MNFNECPSITVLILIENCLKKWRFAKSKYFLVCMYCACITQFDIELLRFAWRLWQIVLLPCHLTEIYDIFIFHSYPLYKSSDLLFFLCEGFHNNFKIQRKHMDNITYCLSWLLLCSLRLDSLSLETLTRRNHWIFLQVSILFVPCTDANRLQWSLTWGYSRFTSQGKIASLHQELIIFSSTSRSVSSNAFLPLIEPRRST